MESQGVPVTFENYLAHACLGRSHELGPEEVAQMPEQLQREYRKKYRYKPS
jgi:hypothetical protein